MQILTDSTSSHRNGMWLARMQSRHEGFIHSGFKQFSTLSFGFGMMTAKLQNGHSTCGNRMQRAVRHHDRQLTATHSDPNFAAITGTVRRHHSSIRAPSQSVLRRGARLAAFVLAVRRIPSSAELS